MTLLRRYAMMLPKLEFGVINFIGIGTNVPDNSANTTYLINISPPAGMVAGDLVVAFIHARSSNHHPCAITNDGGQVWNNLIQYNNVAGDGQTERVDWCQFNGTWTANPQWTFASGTSTRPTSGQLMVFRSTAPRFLSWGYDNYNLGGIDATNPIVVTAMNTLNPATVSISYWYHSSSATWGVLSGAGWVQLGGAQYRVISGLNQTVSYAYKTMMFPQSTGAVQRTKSGADGPFGLQLMYSFNVNIKT